MFRTYDGPAGRLQDRIGPRMVASMELFHSGWSCFGSFASAGNILPAVIGFGCLAGTGFGLGYSAATPAAVKWFPPRRKVSLPDCSKWIRSCAGLHRTVQ